MTLLCRSHSISCLSARDILHNGISYEFITRHMYFKQCIGAREMQIRRLELLHATKFLSGIP